MELLMDIVSNIGDDEFYRSYRYDVPLVVVLINSMDKNIFDIIDENIRQADIIQQLSSELIVVFLTHTNYKDALLYLDKIKRKADFTYTLAEYKELKSEFIKKLFSDNEDKLI
ncbi:MAG: hypothetical protein KAT10_03410 [Sulfurimonas sp.]|nr:hypothetical protein [Sulfurimonas sp.]